MLWIAIALGIVAILFGALWWSSRLQARSSAQMLESFKALSSDALRNNNESFLQLANSQLEKFQTMAQKDLEVRQGHIQELLLPVRESLEKVDLKMLELEKSRVRSDESLFQQLKSLTETQKDLRMQTQQLTTALRAPQVRGRWGEIQLKRVVEMAGMLEHCDFLTQTSTQTEDGRLRPDMLVKLPGGKRIVVDAKAPLMAFLDSLQDQSIEGRQQKLIEHSRHVRKHIEQLGRKSYWDQFAPAPVFVVLFLPGEHFFSAALENDAALIDFGVQQNVIVATPTTLIALLRAVAYGWRQERLADNARQMGELGKELYKRLGDFVQHLTRVGKSLESSVDSYNKAVGSLESRVLVSARKFKEMDGSTGSEWERPSSIDLKPRLTEATEDVRGG